MGILWQYIIVLLLSAVTFGIYSSWGIVRLNKYIFSHTHVDGPAYVAPQNYNV